MATGVGAFAIPLINSASDIIFGTLDAALGYKTWEEAGFEMGKSLLINTASSLIGAGTNFLSSTIKTSSSVGKAVLQGTTSALGSYTTSVASSYINAYDFKTGEMDWETANSSWYSAKTIATMVSAGVSSGLGSYLSNPNVLSASQQKFFGGAINLATAGGAELAKYGVYTAYNLGAGMKLGGSFKKAYDDMGGLTINILNMGSIFDMIAGGIARNNDDGQLANSASGVKLVGDLRKAFDIFGLFEVNFGSGGITSRIGTGGIDVGGAFYDLAKRGIDYSKLQNMEDGRKRNIAMDAYINGDWTAENTSMRIASGLDDLELYSDYGNIGYTRLKSSGKGRVISIQDSGNDAVNAVYLQHEAYRNGITNGDNSMETRLAAWAHTEMLKKMDLSWEELSQNQNLVSDLIAYNMGMNFFNAYVDGNYDSSADYWKLTREGNLEYDGFATLRDADGKIIRAYTEMGLSSDNSIEGALLWLLNIDPNDSASVGAVRIMMANSGLSHSFGLNSDNWFWKGEHIAITTTDGYYPTLGMVNLTDANMRETITMDAIAELFTFIGASGNRTNESINRIYGSSVGFLNYADTGGKTDIANSILLNYYTLSQLTMIHENQLWLRESIENSVNINGMISGNYTRTSEFNKMYNNIPLSSSPITGAKFFSELHTGFDYMTDGSEIYAPGGNWQLYMKDGHKAYYQLYGSDLRMRIQHLDDSFISSLVIGTIYSGTEKIADYPTSSNGAGSDIHVHIDFTRLLPYNGQYVRQFVNPETLRPANRLEYEYAYKDAQKLNFPNYPMNFYRF